MALKKPINITFETLTLILIAILETIWIIFVRRDASLVLALNIVVYSGGIISIVVRTQVSKERERRSISSFLFGFLCGLWYGTALAFFSSDTIELPGKLLTMGIILWGIAAGLIAMLCSYIISLDFIKDVYRSFSHKDKQH